MKAQSYWIVLLAGIWTMFCQFVFAFGQPIVPRFVNLNGTRIAYYVAGKGPTCILPSQGWGMDVSFYVETLKPLEQFFTMVYVDTCGSGQSDSPKSDVRFDSHSLSADLEEMRIHLKQEKIWLFGHARAGFQLQRYASSYPNRVEGLIFVSTPAVNDIEKNAASISKEIQRRKNDPRYAELLDVVKSIECPDNDKDLSRLYQMNRPLHWSNPQLFREWKKHFETVSIRSSTFSAAAVLSAEPFDLTLQLTKVKAPALLVVGDDDFECKPDAIIPLRKVLANSTVLLIEHCGHYPWLEQRKRFFEGTKKFLLQNGIQQAPN